MSAPSAGESSNVARRLSHFAREMPDSAAVVMPLRGRDSSGRRRYASVTFAELDADSDAIARGLRTLGITPGTRLALLVKPGIDFVSLVFALLKAGAVIILIDPGMGRKNLIGCLAEAEPEGFVAVSFAQALRIAFRRRFPKARCNVTVGRRWFWRGPTLAELRRIGAAATEPATFAASADDPAAIIFTTGSTGPPKGVLYTHGNFDRQVEEIRAGFQILPGEVNLACFPMFGLFNAAMGVTTVVPEMDASRPANVDPANIVEAVRNWNVTQSFASPAVWNKVGEYCTSRKIKLPTLREAYSAGAPVPPPVIERMVGCLADGGRLHTPYGATEALPVSTIASPEILGETRAAYAAGKGTCVGRAFPGIEWKVIRICDEPICTIDRAEVLPPGEIGELIVRGPVVTKRYVTRIDANAMAKIHDSAANWHRMGDAGYFDREGRFWFCGRTAHRVVTEHGVLFTDPVEGVFNQHPAVFRSALVGVGLMGMQRPVVVVELLPNCAPVGNLIDELRELGQRQHVTKAVNTFLIHTSLPVDIRHNSKIFREKLAVWAAKKLRI